MVMPRDRSGGKKCGGRLDVNARHWALGRARALACWLRRLAATGFADKREVPAKVRDGEASPPREAGALPGDDAPPLA